MQGTFFGSGAPFGVAGAQTPWSGLSFGARSGEPVAPQQLIQLLQFVPHQLQRVHQQLEFLQQQQLQQLQILQQVIPQQLQHIYQTIQYLPQQVQQYQQYQQSLGPTGSSAINPFQS